MSTVLVIDDDEILRSATRVTLAAAGHLVLEAAGPQRGLERIHERVPDLVLCDQDLGKGTTFIARLPLISAEKPPEPPSS